MHNKMSLFLRAKSKFRKQLLYYAILESILPKETDLNSDNEKFLVQGVVGKSGKVLLAGVYTEQAKNAQQQWLDNWYPAVATINQSLISTANNPSRFA